MSNVVDINKTRITQWNSDDLDQGDWDTNDFIENQVGISITIASVNIGNEKFNLSSMGG